MKMFVLVCFAAIVATATASYCHHTSDCSLVTCNQGFTLRCYSDHVCTCIADYHTFNCSQPAQCEHAFGSCRHGDHHWHCIDNRCMCRLPNND